MFPPFLYAFLFGFLLDKVKPIHAVHKIKVRVMNANDITLQIFKEQYALPFLGIQLCIKLHGLF